MEYDKISREDFVKKFCPEIALEQLFSTLEQVEEGKIGARKAFLIFAYVAYHGDFPVDVDEAIEQDIATQVEAEK